MALVRRQDNLERRDPSLSDGFRLLYDRPVTLEVRTNEQEGVGYLQTIRAKLLIMGPETAPEAVRLELSDNDDLFFHYYHALDKEGFRMMQKDQKLRIKFAHYTNMVIELFNLCIQQPHKTMVVLYLFATGVGRLDFVQNLEFKFVEMLSADLVKTPHALVQQHIVYRYASMKQRVELLEEQLKEVDTLVRNKNPSLLLQIKRNTHPINKNINSNSNSNSSSSSYSAGGSGNNSGSKHGSDNYNNSNNSGQSNSQHKYIGSGRANNNRIQSSSRRNNALLTNHSSSSPPPSQGKWRK